MSDEELLLFNDIYNQTQHFGRTQFVREIMKLQQENKELKENYERMYNCNCILRENRNKTLEYIKYCQTSDDDIFPVIEAEKMIEILKGVE